METPPTIPTDPFTPLVEQAISFHELYVSFQRAGFNRAEALSLVSEVLHASICDGGG